MPRPGPRRPHIGIRLSTDDIDWLDTEAARRGVNRSEMIRIAIEHAKQTLNTPRKKATK